MIYILLIAYISILAFIAIRSYPKVVNYSDFFVARKKGNYFSITGSLVATILGGSAIIGAVDEGLKIGSATSWYMICASIGLFALVPLVSKVNRTGKYTLPDMLGEMYNKKAGRIASYVIPVAWLGIIAAQIIAAARILNSFTSLSYEAGAIIAGCVFIAYTIAGGQISILKTDLFQAILVLTGLGIVGYFTYKVGCTSVSENALKFPFNMNFRPIDVLILLTTYSSTFTVGPDIYSRIFCTDNKKTAIRAVLTAAIILLPVSLIIGLISFYGGNCLPVFNVGSVLIGVCNSVLPIWAVSFIVISLLSALLSSADTTLLSASIIVTGLIEKENYGAKTLNKTRFIIFITGLLSIFLALNYTSVIGILLIALTVYSGAFIIPILFGLLNINVNKERVNIAIISGGIIALTGKIISISGMDIAGNILIISAFVLNALILIIKGKRKVL